MPPKTKGQLKDELKHIRHELAEAKAKLEEEVAETVAAAEERARESDKKLKKELQTARRECDEAKKELTEATEELAAAHDKIGELESMWEVKKAATLLDATSSEMGSVIVRELEDARDEVLEALDRTQWEMEKLKGEHELQVL